MSDVQEVQVGIRRTEAGGLVEFGPIVNGTLIPFAAVRQGDFDESVAAAAQTQPQQEGQPQQGQPQQQPQQGQ